MSKDRVTVPLATLRTSMLGAVAGVLLLLGAIGLLAREYYQDMQEVRYWLRQARAITQSLDVLMIDVLDLETGQRGYLLTRDESYLEPYHRSRKDVEAGLDKLRKLVTGRPRQREALAGLESVIAKRVEAIDTSIEIARSAGPEAALAFVKGSLSRELMDEIRVRVDEISAAHERLLLEHTRALRRVESRAALLAAMGTVLGIGLLLAAGGFAYRELVRRRLAHESAVIARDLALEADHAKNQFLASAAHDLRQPVQIIRLALAAIEKSQPGKFDRELGPALRAIHMLDRTLMQFVDARRLASNVWLPAPEPFELRDFLQALSDAYAPLARRAALKLRCRTPELWVYADKGMVERILGNLLVNAIKYTQKGGVLLAARRKGDQALIRVWDTGPGISSEEFDQLFREFGRAREGRNKEGAGLGLFVSSQIARALGTRLTVSSKAGKGSCFAFTLPIAEPPARAAARAEAQRNLVG